MMNFTMRAAAALTADLSYVKIKFDPNGKSYTYLCLPNVDFERGDLALVPVNANDREGLDLEPHISLRVAVASAVGKIADLDIGKLSKDIKFLAAKVDLDFFEEAQNNLEALELDLSKRRNRNTQATVLAQLGIAEDADIPALAHFKPVVAEA